MIALATFAAAVSVLLWIPPSSRLRRRLDRPAEPDRRSSRGRARAALVGSGLGVGVLSVGLAAGPAAAAVALATTIATATAVRLLRHGRRTRAEHQAQVAVATACSVVAGQVRVGRVPTEALLIAAEDSPVLRPACRVHTSGGDVVAALRVQAADAGCHGLADLARAWQVATRTGAPMADLLDQVATSLRSDQAIQHTVTAELAGPRATGRVMAVLPLCGIGLGYLLGGHPLGFLVAGPLGWACLVGGAALAACGVLWIEWLARQVGGPV